MFIDGKNINADLGTLAFRVKFNGSKSWNDSKETWLAVLLPLVGEPGLKTTEEGTSLALVKDSQNYLSLYVHEFFAESINNGFIRPHLAYDYRSYGSFTGIAPPDQVAVRIRVGDLESNRWHGVRLSWNRSTGKVQMAINERVTTSKLTFRKSPINALLLGSPPNELTEEILNFDGQMDDVYLDQKDSFSSLGFPLTIPIAAKSKEADPGVAQVSASTKVSPLDEKSHLAETAARLHLEQVIASQKSYGWAYRATYPGRMRFLSEKVYVPYSDRFFNASKDDNSAGIALRLLAAYEALGDSIYLKTAMRTADLYVELQDKMAERISNLTPEVSRQGGWPGTAIVEDDGEGINISYIGSGAEVFIEDHVQTAPITLMLRLFEITGKSQYSASAMRGADFLLTAQNPNGSWSIAYDTVLGHGTTVRNLPRGGEINDHTTTEAMQVMLILYRLTKKEKYLNSYLRGARWLRDSFIHVPGKVTGWAKQYDESNQPVTARHFEPASVSVGPEVVSAPRELMHAYRLTGDTTFLTPVSHWYQWMKSVEQKPTAQHPGGWYPDYDPLTGQPIKMFNDQMVPPSPSDIRNWKVVGAVLKEYEQIDLPLPSFSASMEENLNVLNWMEDGLQPNLFLMDFSFSAGTFIFDDSVHGKVMSPGTPRLMPLLQIVFLRRQVLGQIPFKHRCSEWTNDDWYETIFHLVPRSRLYERLN